MLKTSKSFTIGVLFVCLFALFSAPAIGQVTVDIVSPPDYEVGTLQLPPDTTACYIDRGYYFLDAPEYYVGLPFIRTALGDKNNSSEEFLTFHVNKPVTVYVCYSEYAAPGPDWLENSFVNTGDQISRHYHTWNIWQRDYPAGDITLGGNMAQGAASSGGSMYVCGYYRGNRRTAHTTSAYRERGRGWLGEQSP